MEFLGTYYVLVSEDGTCAIPDAWSACFIKDIVLMRVSSEVDAIECMPEPSDYGHVDDMGYVASKEKSEVDATCSGSRDFVRMNLAEGRLMIPENMRKELGITHQVVLVGAFNTFWIWEPSVWEDEQSGCNLDDADIDIGIS